MATLILSAASTAVGGPLGGVVGSLLGRQIDRSFGRSPAARLSDLRAPSSQYGDPIPAVTRSMRVAGVVLWASAPVATASVSKSGTSPGSIVSFAYGLSSRRVEEIGRIWADGRLIRDAEGRQDVSFTLRLHAGDEDQSSDPLIASLLGENQAPAFRGIAYLLFENFDLSSFGNRPPLITIEIVGGDEPLIAEDTICTVLDLDASDLSDTHVLEGCAFSGDNWTESLAPLLDAFEPSFRFDGRKWALGISAAQHSIDHRLWLLEDDAPSDFEVGELADAPTKVSVRYFDPSLDFQAGEKSARRPGVERLRRIELPVAMGGEQAKAIAFERLVHAREDGRAMWLELPLSFADICVGDTIHSDDAPDAHFVISEKVLKASKLRFRLRQLPVALAPLPGDAGGAASARMLKRTPLSVALVELPGSGAADEPEIAVLVSGGHEPFRALPVALDVGGINTEMLSAPIAAPQGHLNKPLPMSESVTFDLANVLDVSFDPDPHLASCDDAALHAGDNMLCVAGEFIQFGFAKPLGGGRYELTRLIRGRFDSGRHYPHEAGASVHFLDPAAMTTLKVPRDRIGTLISVQVLGPDEIIAEASATVSGWAAQPWVPTHLRVKEVVDGLHLAWVRRCREGGPWLDGVDAPLGSSRELYSVSLEDARISRVDLQSDEPSAFISSEMLAQLGTRPWRLEIRQLGDFAAGKPLVHTID